MKVSHRGRTLAALTITAAAALAACGGSDDNATPARQQPQSIAMTWFGITNWHYQVGELGILLDGETKNQGSTPDAASVTKALTSLRRGGTVDVILVGHEHGDHSVQVPEWAKQTGKPVYAPGPVCARFAANGLPASQCTTLKGGETLALNQDVDVHVVRWVHSVDCDELSNGTGGPDTFGFLIVARTGKGDEKLNLFVTDSGAGGPDLTTPRIVNGVAQGSPLSNMNAAMKAAGLTHLDIWQGGPESRMVYQARTVVPAFDVRTFMPHHLNSRASGTLRFNLSYGMHYAYKLEDQPKLKAFLEASSVPQVYPTNYFDKWEYTKTGIAKVANTQVKADYGLPADGPGPGVQAPNPRAGNLECVQD